MTSPILGLFNLGGSEIILILALLLVSFISVAALMVFALLILRAIKRGAAPKLEPSDKG
jgi:hypothetical protein